MAGHEDEAQEIVPHVRLDCGVHFQAFLSPFQLASNLFVFALKHLATPDQVERAVLGRAHEPGARTLRHTLCGPLFERGDKGVLRELLSRPDVTDDASQPGDEPGGLDPPDRFDRAMRLGGCCLAATSAFGRAFPSRIYGERSLTVPPSRRSDGS